MRFAVLALASVFSALADAPSTPACVSCHPAETKLHSSTRMAHAMIPAASSAFAQNLPIQPLQESIEGYRFSYQLVPEGLSVKASRGNQGAEGLIQWVLGAGSQGQTPLVRSPAGSFESRVSYFPQLHQYGITIGQDAGTSDNPNRALGRKQRPQDLQNCIACHSTAITRDFEPVVPGIQCQRCHPGADEHALGHGTPLNPGKLEATAQVRLCGTCHRTKPPVDDNQLENVRFQPLRLMKSRCFVSKKLACTTCHPAHQDARRHASDFYNEKCLTCHAGPQLQAHLDQRQKGDCIGCHMPYVELHPALKFTDHFIRVVKADDLPGAIIRQRATGP